MKNLWRVMDAAYVRHPVWGTLVIWSSMFLVVSLIRWSLS